MTFSTISCIFWGVNGKRNPASLAFPNSTNAAFAEAMHSRHSGPGVAVSGALWGKPRMDPHGSVNTDPYGQIAHVGGYRGLLLGLPHCHTTKFSMQDLRVKL